MPPTAAPTITPTSCEGDALAGGTVGIGGVLVPVVSGRPASTVMSVQAQHVEQHYTLFRCRYCFVYVESIRFLCARHH